MLKNFRVGLFSCVHLLFVLLLLLTGVVAVLGHFIPNAKYHLVHVLLNYSNLLLIVGCVIIFFAITLLFGFFNSYKARYYTIKMGVSKAVIEEAIIQDYIKGYWAKLFPNEQIEIEIIIHSGQTIEIVAKNIANSTQELLDKIQNELGVLLAKKLGYNKDFFVTMIYSPLNLD